MPDPGTILAILKASNYLSPEIIEKIERLASATPPLQFFEKLVTCDLLSSEFIQKLQEFLRGLEEHFPSKDSDREGSIYSLTEEKKKDILFARQVLAEGLCSIEKINQCFEEQVKLESTSDKLFQISQIMVKQHIIPVDRFVIIHREIEKKCKNSKLDELLTQDKSLIVTIKDKSIHFRETSIPENFGSYKIIEEIGRGGMGVVYKAWDSKLRRYIALKILKAWENPPLEEIQRFHREARLAASLTHPNIVNIYDAGVVDGVHYYTMDYVEGQTLAEILAKGALDHREALIIAREIALALDYAHSRDVIHRDVKPANIILDASNRPLLMDFGLAKGMNTAETGHLTKSGAALGTPTYMSPEQAQGSSKINAKSDIYSLGAVLYEMVTGRPPFEAGSFGMLISDVISKEPIAPTRLNPNLHVDIENICLKAMAKAHEQRYENARVMAKDIDQFLQGNKLQIAKKSSFYYRLHKRLSPYAKYTKTAVIILSICLLGILWWLLKNYYQTKRAQQVYDSGYRFWQTQDYRTAIPLFWKASQSIGLSEKVAELLRQTAQFHADDGTRIWEDYANKNSMLTDQYRKELSRLQKSQNFDEKLKTLQRMEEIGEFRSNNYKKLFLAAQHFRYSLICDPANSKSLESMSQIHQMLAMVSKNEEKYTDWFCSSAQFYKPSRDEFPKGSLSIVSQPPSDVHLFVLEEHYLKQAPVPWHLRQRYFLESNSHGDNQKYRGDDFISYLKLHYWVKNDVILDKNSFLAISPIENFVLMPGHYLLVLSCRGYMSSRLVLTISQGQQHNLSISLLPQSPMLENYVHLPSISPEAVYHYCLAKFEVSFKEYVAFLNDPEVLEVYKNTKSRGILRLVPRNHNSPLEEILEYKFGKFFLRDKKYEDISVCGICWQDARDYCEWLTKRHSTRVEYALPPFEIWQVAAGREDGRLYPWGNYFDLSFVLEHNFDLESEHNINISSSVATKIFDVSPYGVYSMAGNVREWCSNGDTSKAMVCGGSLELTQPVCFQIGYNNIYHKEYTSRDIGFRIMALIRKN